MQININNLLKEFENKIAVNINSLNIGSGELFGLVGNNGAGKTTLFRLILDLLKPNRGRVLINNIPVNNSEKWKKYTGAFLDNNFLIDYLSAEEYFYFIGKLYGLLPNEVDFRLASYSRFMNNEILGQKKYIRNYSSGNKQKIGILGRLIVEPKVLILDEPFNFLDPTSQILMKEILISYNQRTSATILISSHNLNGILEVCSKIALMRNGHIIKIIENTKDSVSVLEEYFTINL